MAASKTIDRFVRAFSCKSHFTKDDLYRYYLKTEPALRDATLRRRINILKNRGLISEISRGTYSFQNKQVWIPSVNNSVRTVYRKLGKNYNDLLYDVWSTAWLGEFTNLQAFRYHIIIEVEKDYVSSVFDFLKESGLKNLYLQPGKKEVDNYLASAGESYVVETLITKSPVQLVGDVRVPRLEKILVDLYCRKDLFSAFQGHELSNIFEKAFSYYSINISLFINYARRRGRESELFDYLRSNTTIKIPTL
ncbi:MAG: hypothetical protein FJY10_09130 [Bacteroidetes bacterium]|nr:hypothetical protein [Bacteroidota bacterium]